MPSLDSCLNDIYEPGNIPTDPGQTPTIPLPAGNAVGTASGVGAASALPFGYAIGRAYGIGTASATQAHVGVASGSGVATAFSAGVTAWTPVQLGSDLKFWYKADLISGSDQDNVGTWPDSSGNANTATAVTPSAHKLEVAELNGMNVVRASSAAGSRMNVPTMAAFSAGTAIFVVKCTATGGAMGAPIDSGTSSSSTERAHYVHTDNIIYDPWGSSVRKTVGDPGDTESWHIGCMRSATNDWKYFFNGTQFFTTATNTVGFRSNPFLFFNRTESWNGYAAEFVVTNTAVTQTDREKLEGYLAHKWGITSVLDGGHPYKTNPPTI